LIMFVVFLIALFVSGVVCQPPVPAGYGLVWSEEFSTESLDWTKNGNFYSGSTGKPRLLAVDGCYSCNSNNTYTPKPSNVFVTGGNLVLQAQPEPKGSQYGYTSGNVISYCANQAQQWCPNGGTVMDGGSWIADSPLYFDIRAKMPAGPGFWPAIWMLPTDFVKYGWPLGGEIDIMEGINSENRWIQSTLHWDKNNTSCWGHYDIPSSQPDVAQAFHSYGMYWDNTQSPYFKFHFDGNIINTNCPMEWSGGPAGKSPAPFNTSPFLLILNLAVGGDWPKNPPPETKFPVQMLVDYVRVYQKGKGSLPNVLSEN